MTVLYLLFTAVLTNQVETCAVDKLYGEWIFLNVYSGKLISIDTLPKNSFESNYGTPKWSYLKTGKYINDQGDYKTEGQFTVNFENCTIKTFNDNDIKGDTLAFEITYLDSQYLMIANMDKETSYFYKRK